METGEKELARRRRGEKIEGDLPPRPAWNAVPPRKPRPYHPKEGEYAMKSILGVPIGTPLVGIVISAFDEALAIMFLLLMTFVGSWAIPLFIIPSLLSKSDDK